MGVRSKTRRRRTKISERESEWPPQLTAKALMHGIHGTVQFWSFRGWGPASGAGGEPWSFFSVAVRGRATLLWRVPCRSPPRAPNRRNLWQVVGGCLRVWACRGSVSLPSELQDVLETAQTATTGLYMLVVVLCFASSSP